MCPCRTDARVGKRTTSVRLGRKAVTILGPAFYFVIYLSIVLGVILRMLPAWTLLGLLSLPLPFVIDRVAKEEKVSYLPATSLGGLTHFITCILIAVGFLVSVLL